MSARREPKADFWRESGWEVILLQPVRRPSPYILHRSTKTGRLEINVMVWPSVGQQKLFGGRSLKVLFIAFSSS